MPDVASREISYSCQRARIDQRPEEKCTIQSRKGRKDKRKKLSRA
jgi:hypothetical protein